MTRRDQRRRAFLFRAVSAGGLLAGGTAWGTVSPRRVERGVGAWKKSAAEEEEVTPAEDLMREHGVLNRILLVYEECIRRLDARRPLPIDTLASAADLVRRFIEQYHEKLEEEHLFPRFERANKLVDLVGTLRRQHRAGRGLTETILQLATARAVEGAADRQRLVEALRLFVRMYRPHEAREDTVLFPALPTIIRHQELEALGAAFEEKEHDLFGKAGFEGVVVRVGALEQTLGIYALDQFTPGA